MPTETFDEFADRQLRRARKVDTALGIEPTDNRRGPEIATPVVQTPSVRAAKLVTGDRQASYGHPYPNHKRIADFWNARLGEILLRPLEPHEVAACMRLVKEARLMQTPGHADSLDDIAGYADVEYLIHTWEGEDG